MQYKLRVLPVLLFCFALAGAKTRVSDEAGLLGAGEAAVVEQRLEAVSAEYGNDLFVLTRKGLDGVPTRTYAENFFLGNHHGGATGSGAVLLVDMGGRDMGVYTFGKAIPAFESRVDGILDKIAPRLTRGEYYQVCLYFADAMRPRSFLERFLAMAGSWITWIGAALVTLIVFLVLNRKPDNGKAVSCKTYEVSGSFAVIKSADDYLRTTTTSTRIQKSSSSGGSGGGSGRSGGGGRSF